MKVCQFVVGPCIKQATLMKGIGKTTDIVQMNCAYHAGNLYKLNADVKTFPVVHARTCDQMEMSGTSARKRISSQTFYNVRKYDSLPAAYIIYHYINENLWCEYRIIRGDIKKLFKPLQSQHILSVEELEEIKA